MKGGIRPVYFKKEAVKLHEDLVNEGLNSQSFPDFTRTAFHEKVDRIRAKQITKRAMGYENEEEECPK